MISNETDIVRNKELAVLPKIEKDYKLVLEFYPDAMIGEDNIWRSVVKLFPDDNPTLRIPSVHFHTLGRIKVFSLIILKYHEQLSTR